MGFFKDEVGNVWDRNPDGTSFRDGEMLSNREIHRILVAEGKKGFIITYAGGVSPAPPETPPVAPLEKASKPEKGDAQVHVSGTSADDSAGLAEASTGLETVATRPERYQDPAPAYTEPPAILEGCRFVKIRPREKGAFETGWSTSANYDRSDPALLEHLAKGGNYGVMPAGGICILDADEALELGDLLELFMDTFTVRTGGDGVKFHFYFRCKDLNEKIPFFHPETGKHLGEIYGSGAHAYCVGPGSVHPSGRRYEIVRDLPLKEISTDDLFLSFLSRVKNSKVKPAASTAAAAPAAPTRRREISTVGGTITDQLNLRVEEFLSPANAVKQGDELVGEHPVHGSSTGSNLHVNVAKNQWKCHRCGSGGGPLEALAVAEQLIRCDQAQPNCLENLWPELFGALRRRGYNVASRDDAKRGIILRRSKAPIPAAEAKDALGCMARSLRLQGTFEDETLDIIAKINYSGRMETPLPDGEVLKIVAEAYKALTLAGARRKTELERKTPPELQQAAQRILSEGKVLAYFREVYATLHSEDVPTLDSILCGFAVMSAVNTLGIQPAVNGPRGTGKTTGAKAALHLAPPERVFKTSLSNKALFYDVRLRPGIAIFSDDTTLDDALLETIKRAMSNYQEQTEHLTVEKGSNGNKARALIIPPRIMFLFTAVGDTGDDQLNDRQYMISTEPTPEGDDRFLEFLVQRVMEGREELRVTDDVLVCREILRDIGTKLFRVIIPWASRVQFLDKKRRRNLGSFFEFVMASAILNYRKRVQGHTPGDPENIVTLEASIEDFELARDVFRYNQDTRAYDLTKEERALLDWIIAHDYGGGIPETDIVRDFKTKSGQSWNRGKVRRLLYGDADGSFRGGLLNKVPGLYPDKRSLEIGEKSHRLVNVIFAPTSVASTLADYESWVRLKSEPQQETEPAASGSNALIGNADQQISTGEKK